MGIRTDVRFLRFAFGIELIWFKVNNLDKVGLGEVCEIIDIVDLAELLFRDQKVE